MRSGFGVCVRSGFVRFDPSRFLTQLHSLVQMFSVRRWPTRCSLRLATLATSASNTAQTQASSQTVRRRFYDRVSIVNASTDSLADPRAAYEIVLDRRKL